MGAFCVNENDKDFLKLCDDFNIHPYSMNECVHKFQNSNIAKIILEREGRHPLPSPEYIREYFFGGNRSEGNNAISTWATDFRQGLGTSYYTAGNKEKFNADKAEAIKKYGVEAVHSYISRDQKKYVLHVSRPVLNSKKEVLTLLQKVGLINQYQGSWYINKRPDERGNLNKHQMEELLNRFFKSIDKLNIPREYIRWYKVNNNYSIDISSSFKERPLWGVSSGLMFQQPINVELNKLRTLNNPLNRVGSTKKQKEYLKKSEVNPYISSVIMKAVEIDRSLASLKPIDIFNTISRQWDNDLALQYQKYIESEVDSKLEQHLKNYLDKYHINVFEDGIAEEFGVTGIFDILNKTIHLAKNRNAISMSEEFAHAFVRLMGANVSNKEENKDYTFLFNSIESTSIYQKVLEEYKNTYTKEEADGTRIPDINKIKEEAIGQALAVAINNRWNNKYETTESSFWVKLKEWFNKIISLFSDAEYINIDSLLAKIADEVISNDYSRLAKVDSSKYSLLDYAETVANQNKKDGGKAIEFMQYFTEKGLIITGSFSYRKQGTVYRGKMDSLHDIDMQVPLSTHGIHLDSSVVRQAVRNNKWGTTILLDYCKETTFFKDILEHYPDLQLTAAYYDSFSKGITINSIYSEDPSIREKFALMSGSYASRLEKFTDEERDKIYLFDFFLNIDDNKETVYDKENKIMLEDYKGSLIPKLNMGRAKDIFDYQMWELFLAYKNNTLSDEQYLMYLKIQYNPGQTVAIDRISSFIEEKLHLDNTKENPDYFLLIGNAGSGKAQPVDTVIPTPEGDRRLGDISVGDYVYDRLGNPTRVLGVFPLGIIDSYIVTFEDGRLTKCNDQHIWTYYTSKNNLKSITLKEMLELGLKSPRERSSYKFRIPINKAVLYPEKLYSVDPYVIGAFLGDGCCKEKHLTFSSADEELVRELSSLTGFIYKKCVSNNYSWVFKHNNKKLVYTKDFFKNYINEICCYAADKRIPTEYLYGSIDLRYALLQGLLDTDGSIGKYDNNRFNITYTSTSLRLILDVLKLLYSLGHSAVIHKDKRDYKYTSGNCYSLAFRISNEDKFKIFRLSRKKNIAILAALYHKHKNYDRLAIVNITKEPIKREMVCILVDNPEHLYLTNDFIVTHNTFTIQGIINQVINDTGRLPRVFVTAVSNKATLNLEGKINIKNLKIEAKSTASVLGLKQNWDFFGNEYWEQPQDWDISKSPVIVSGADVLFIDEVSMITDDLFKYLLMLKLASPKLKIVMLGDDAQLPPVQGESETSIDTDTSIVFHHSNKEEYRLTELVRLGEDSPIIDLALTYRNFAAGYTTTLPKLSMLGKGRMTTTGGTILVDKLQYANNVGETVKLLVLQGREEGNPNKVKIVSYRNATRAKYNTLVLDILHPEDKDNADRLYHEGDFIMFYQPYETDTFNPKTEKFETINNSEEFLVKKSLGFEQLDIEGFISELEALNDGTKSNLVPPRVIVQKVLINYKGQDTVVSVVAPNVNAISNLLNFLKNVRSYNVPKDLRKAKWALYNNFVKLAGIVHPGYAITNHKAQGSTYDVTIVDAQDIYSNLLRLNPSKANDVDYVALALAKHDRNIARAMYTAITRSSNITVLMLAGGKDDITEDLSITNDLIKANRANTVKSNKEISVTPLQDEILKGNLSEDAWLSITKAWDDRFVQLNNTINFVDTETEHAYYYYPNGKLDNNNYVKADTTVTGIVNPILNRNAWLDVSARIGSTADMVIRDFFMNKDVSTINYPNLTSDLLKEIIKACKEFKKFLDNKFLGKRYSIRTDNFSVVGKFADAEGNLKLMGGTVDILIFDEDGNYYIYDIKTSRKDIRGDISKKEHYTSQLNSYREMIELTYSELKGKCKGLGLLQLNTFYDTPNGLRASGLNGITVYTFDKKLIYSDGVLLLDSTNNYVSPRLFNDSILDSTITIELKSPIGRYYDDKDIEHIYKLDIVSAKDIKSVAKKAQEATPEIYKENMASFMGFDILYGKIESPRERPVGALADYVNNTIKVDLDAMRQKWLNKAWLSPVVGETIGVNFNTFEEMMTWALLHEMGHMALNHRYVTYSLETKENEANAWATERFNKLYSLLSIKSYYEGNITPDENTIFVFGSNPEGKHGKGAAKEAHDKFGALYGVGEGLTGNAYALPTKDLRVKENNSLRSISEDSIIESIKKLYQTARENPTKQFKVAYRNTDKTSLNGYTGYEMIEMFNQAGEIPSNIIFSKEWFDSGRLNINKSEEFKLADELSDSNIEDLLPKATTTSATDVSIISNKTQDFGVIINPGLKSYTDDNTKKITETFLNNNPKGIVAFRSYEDFATVKRVNKGIIGNPFDWKKYGEGVATLMFYDWLTTGNNAGESLATKELRQAIINRLLYTSRLPKILYYKELGRPSHATVLGYLALNPLLLGVVKSNALLLKDKDDRYISLKKSDIFQLKANALRAAGWNVEFYLKRARDNKTSNEVMVISLPNRPEKGLFELVADKEFDGEKYGDYNGEYSVHFKTKSSKANNLSKFAAIPLTEAEKNSMFKALLFAIPDNAKVSTWGEITKGGISGLNKLGQGMLKVGERTVKDSNGNKIQIPIFQKQSLLLTVLQQLTQALNDTKPLNDSENLNGIKESLVVISSDKTILSNEELKEWNKQGLGNNPRILVGSERTDPAFHVKEILDVIEGKRSVEKKTYTRITQEEYNNLPVSDRWYKQATGEYFKVDKQSLSSKDFAGLYLVTKHDGLPMLLLLETKIPKLIHFSITGLGGTKYEPGVMKYNDLLDKIEDYINQGLDPNTVTIRIDPIIPGVTSKDDIESIVKRASEMGIKRIRFSIMDAYANTKKAMSDLGYDFNKYYNGFHAKQEYLNDICDFMLQLKLKYGVTLGTCAETISKPGISKEGCLSVDAVNNMLGTSIEDKGTDNNTQRTECSCFGGKIDALAYNKNCASHCVYCYAKHESDTAMLYYNEDGTLKNNAFTQSRRQLNVSTTSTVSQEEYDRQLNEILQQKLALATQVLRNSLLETAIDTTNPNAAFSLRELALIGLRRNLRQSNLFKSTELKSLAKSCTFLVSDTVTKLQSNKDYSKEVFPEASLWYNYDFTGMSRIEILGTIGIDLLYDLVRLNFFDARNNKNAKNMKIKTLKKLRVISLNYEAFKEMANSTFISLEGVSMDVEIHSVHDDADDIFDGEDASTIAEITGSSVETWQVGFRLISAFNSLSQLIKLYLNSLKELDENGNPVLNEYGIEERVSATKVTANVLEWTLGASSLSEMVERLLARVKDNTWIQPLIDRLSSSSTDETFKSLFFSNFKKYFLPYMIQYAETVFDPSTGERTSTGRIISKVINQNTLGRQMLDDFHSNWQARTSGNLTLYNANGRINEIELRKLGTALETISEFVLNTNIADTTSEVKEAIKVVYKQFDIEIDDKGVERFNNKDIIKGLNASLTYIVQGLYRNINNANYDLAEEQRSNLTKVFELAADASNNVLESCSYENGKMHYSYVIPSYTSKMITKLRGDVRDYDKFIEKEFGQYQWFKKNGVWRNELIRLLAEDESFRKEFKHAVVLNTSASLNSSVSYTDKSPVLYEKSMLTCYTLEDNYAYYHIPMQSNKPSEEYIRMKKYNRRGWKNDIVDFLKDVALQEIDRIATVRERNNNNVSIKNFDKRGTQFLFLEYLQDYLDAYHKAANNSTISYSSLIEKLSQLQEDLYEAELLENYEDANRLIKEIEEVNKLLLGKWLEDKISKPASAGMYESMGLDLLERAIKEGMDSNFLEYLDTLEKEGMFEQAEDGSYIHLDNIGFIKNDENLTLEDRNNLIMQGLENFFWNDTLASINILQLMVTDVAYYKDTEDLQKRLALLHAPGLRGNLEVKDAKGNKVTDGVTRTIYLKDWEGVVSDAIQNIKLIFENRYNAMPQTNEIEIAEAEEYKKQCDALILAFTDINVTDAQGYSSITSYRKKALIFGKWNDLLEDTYLKILSGNYTTRDLLMAILPLKPFVYSQATKNSDGRMSKLKVGVLNKNSEYVLLMMDAILRGDGRNAKLQAIYDVMEESALLDTSITGGRSYITGIDTVQFESTVKAGLQGAIDITEANNAEEAKQIIRKAIYSGQNQDGTANINSVYNLDYVHELDFEDYCILSEVPAHLEGESIFGSLIRILAIADMPETINGEELFITINNRRVSIRLAKESYMKAISDNIQESFNELIDEFNLTGSTAEKNIALSRMLLKQVKADARFGDDMLYAVSTDEYGRWNIPLSDPIQAGRIQSLLNSIIKNRINKQLIKGGPVVQVTNFGTSTELEIRFKDDKGNTLQTFREFYLNRQRPGYLYKDLIKLAGYEKYKNSNKPEDLVKYRLYETVYLPVAKAYQQQVLFRQAGIAYMECYAPSKVFMEDFPEAIVTKADGTLFLDITKVPKEALEMIGFRIPTEAKYSMAPLKIVGFLPHESGEGIMLPKDITLLSGSDFD